MRAAGWLPDCIQNEPPAAPHFGGDWECKIKATLQVVVRSQIIPEIVLHTVLVEVEVILHSKPPGYFLSDVADPNPVTRNMVLMV